MIIMKKLLFILLLILTCNIALGNYSGYYQTSHENVASGNIILPPYTNVTGVSINVTGDYPAYTPIVDDTLISNPLYSGLFLGWDFSGNAVNIGGNNSRNGTVNGATLTTDRFGVSNKAYDFNGLTNVVTSPSLIYGNNFTFSCWFNPDSYGGSSGGRIAAFGAGYGIVTNNASGVQSIQILRGFSTTSGTWDLPTGSIKTGNWYHIVVSYDASSTANNPIVYLNGVQQTVTRTVGPVGTANALTGVPMYVGNRAAGDRGFDGKIDSVRVYIPRVDGIANTYYNGFAGIGFKPSNTTVYQGYLGGVQTLTINGTVPLTGIQYLGTDGLTRSFNATYGFLENIELENDTQDLLYQNISIVHTSVNNATGGAISYPFNVSYVGEPVLESNNTNSVLTQNDTHLIIDTGELVSGDIYYYNVSIPKERFIEGTNMIISTYNIWILLMAACFYVSFPGRGELTQRDVGLKHVLSALFGLMISRVLNTTVIDGTLFETLQYQSIIYSNSEYWLFFMISISFLVILVLNIYYYIKQRKG